MAQHLIRLTSSPPALPPPVTTCIPHGGCKWRPPSSSSSSGTLGDFQAYAAIAVIILLCALICALALHGAVRCFLRRPLEQDPRPPKHSGEAMAAPICPGPAVAFSPGMDMAGGEECAICLTEFVEGEEIRLMAECRHGFHGMCIERWLRSHSSCPNCRRNCLVVNVDVDNAEAGQASFPVPAQQHF
ncbi:hypothetical protein CDL15_Pgr028780 [Punica granatum]|nr:hypothetical protein CDL15_Pgr028780 [Punica granatum]